ncbi:DUF3168 domain-containing protein [Palleronia sp. LCG004]|uniref:DUF3168 domain-containing protein n=1 Tax=Palleronia sp. LCG004 TaxID=3079304 RepID=UPI002943E0A9|nr:DUF3168 domain-containing protein [Palleronia sp. LCG004]WOI55127.1 DUF3168 domain-containing protein [Palleronia sp. LCG004]
MIDLAVQIALRARLVASPDVTVDVPPDAILDRNARPAPTPGIVMGEAQVIDVSEIDLDHRRSRVTHTLHIWQRSQSREGVKRIMGAMRAAILPGRLDLGPELHAVQTRVTQMRALSDPDGETAHGVLTVEILVEELAP